MKKLHLLYVLPFFVLFLSGCGKNGQDGKAYLSIDLDWYVDSYWDNNSGIPYGFSENYDYNVQPGTYDYSYDCSDGNGNSWSYDGSYTISINKGEEGGFLVDGKDGEDKHFHLYCYGDGPSFNSSAPVILPELENIKNNLKKIHKSKNYISKFNEYKKLKEGEEIIDTMYSGTSFMIIRAQKYIYVK